MTLLIKAVARTANELGEGILWDWRCRRLLWVDIPRQRLYGLDDGQGVPREMALPGPAGFIALAAGGGYIASAGNALYRLDGDLNALSPWHDLAQTGAETRINDGKADRHGGMVFGTAHVAETRPLGAAYHARGGEIAKQLSGFVVFNGPAFAPDGQRVYFTDSPSREIRTAVYDPGGGIDPATIARFATLPREAGYPDGMTVDSEGFLWNAHWDGARVTRYAPDGRVDRVIALPVVRPTALCFASHRPGLLFVSSAAADRPRPPEGADNIRDGDVLGIPVGINGINESETHTG